METHPSPLLSSQELIPLVTVDDLLRRCQNLLSELEAYQKYVLEHKRMSNGHGDSNGADHLRPFRNAVLAEQKSLEKVDLQTLQSLPHPPPSTNGRWREHQRYQAQS
ncbi:hypothetical protein MMC25_004839 [Agyrium rufum]|nr:hypothetical protein [Agyrium rufum]